MVDRSDPRKESIFVNTLIEANRALIALGAIDRREPNASASESLHDCLQTYTNLLTFQRNVGLSPAQSKQLQNVLDRLRAHLQFFGEDV
jgi:hypothetical protein